MVPITGNDSARHHDETLRQAVSDDAARLRYILTHKEGWCDLALCACLFGIAPMMLLVIGGAAL